MSALLYGTFDTLVYITCHGFLPPEILFGGTAIIINRYAVFILVKLHAQCLEYSAYFLCLQQVHFFEHGNKYKERKAGYYGSQHHVLPGKVGIGVFVLRHYIAGNRSR